MTAKKIIPSPCVGICALNAQQVCTGCARTLDEIAQWGQMSEADREAILRRVVRPQKPNETT